MLCHRPVSDLEEFARGEGQRAPRSQLARDPPINAICQPPDRVAKLPISLDLVNTLQDLSGLFLGFGRHLDHRGPGLRFRHLRGRCRQVNHPKSADQCSECRSLSGEGDELVVWKLDRLGRSVSHLVHVVEDLRSRLSAAQAA
jgi:hypothetical protein